MSHGITENDSMVSAGGEVPWHGLGTVIDDASIRSRDINEKAGLDWNVYKAPAYGLVNGMYQAIDANIKTRDGKTRNVQRFFVTVRDDIHSILGVVGPKYTVYNNADAPKFLDTIVDSNEGEYVTAGSLHGGAVCWWLMKLPNDVTVAGDPREKIETYLLFQNTHDGSGAVVVAIVTVRVVCANTLAWAMDDAVRQVKIRHTFSAKDRAFEARRSLQIGFKYTEQMLNVGNELVQTSFSDDEFQGFLDTLLPVPEAESKLKDGRGRTVAMATQNAIKSIYFAKDGVAQAAEAQQHIYGTKWGALQAVSAYANHNAIFRSTDVASAQENRFKKLTAGQDLGAKALKVLTTA